MVKIINIDTIRDRKEEYFPLFWGKWSIGEQDRLFHKQLLTYTNGMLGLPRFFVAEEEGKLLGCYALLLNDINARQDLFPWFAYLYVVPNRRGKGIAKLLLKHAESTFENSVFLSNLNYSIVQGFIFKIQLKISKQKSVAIKCYTLSYKIGDISLEKDSLIFVHKGRCS